MGRQLRDARLETRSARLRLAIRSDPYFRALGDGLHLGYRRRASGGSWLARRRSADGRYREEKIGLADDYSDADGVRFFDYGQAHRKTQAWAGARHAAELAGVLDASKYTVADAMREYLDDYKVRGKSVSQTQHIINTKIVPAIGATVLAKLTKKQVRDWLNGVAAAPSMKRGGKPRDVEEGDEDAKRRRKASANRAMNVLRAALNFAADHDRVATDAAWARVKPFPNVDRAVHRFLVKRDAGDLIKAADRDFADLCRGGLVTGCRYGELCRLKCGDVDTHAKVITVREAKGGKTRHVFLANEGARFFAAMIEGRPRNELVFLRSDGRGWRKSEQIRPMKEACERARIKPAVSFHILRHTHGSWLALAGTPLQVIAKQLGHADIRMTERHYAHLLPNYVADTVRANLPELGIKMKKVRALPSVAAE